MKKFIYFIASPHCRTVKIGVAENISRRLEDLRTSCPCNDLYLHGFIKCDSYEAANFLEHRLHRVFKPFHSHREWFNFEPELKSQIESFITDLPDNWFKSLMEESFTDYFGKFYDLKGTPIKRSTSFSDPLENKKDNML